MAADEMTPDRWRQIERLYEAAVERDGTDRAAFLDEACAGDDALRREVESLLDYERAGEEFLEQPAFDEVARDLARDRDSSSLTGRQIGGYRILEFIGAGGMGEVYRARDVKLGREVALKVISRLAAGDPSYQRRFEEEARFASGLNHPNIVTIYGVGEERDLAYIAMELVSGRTLRALVSERALSLRQALDMSVQLSEALVAAHAKGLMHRDLKPENLMVTTEGLVKVLDFGLAKRQSEFLAVQHGGSDARTVQELTLAGMIVGSVGYMSPEQAAGRPAGLASDQFSLGVILYEMLSGRRAFARDTEVETLSAIIREEPAPIDTLNPAVNAALRELVERCLAKDPAQRYPNVGELAGQLRRIRDQYVAADVPNAPHVLSTSRPADAPRANLPSSALDVRLTRRRAMWAGGLAVAAAASGLATWRLWPAGSGIRSLAVLPFANALQDEDAEYLCDGITESLIRQISRLPSLQVMARSTVFNFKGKTVDPRAAGRQLSVEAILTGSVARQSGRLQITAELADVTTGALLWSDSYDRSAADILVVQDQIASAIIDDGIRLRLNVDERRRLVRHATADPDAYELYLRALYHHTRENERDYLIARDLLQQAVAKDPKFALAHVALASTYTVMAVDGFERPTAAWPQQNRHVQQALEYEPDLPEAHAAAGAEAFFFSWDWAGAEREWKRSIESAGGLVEPDLLLGYSLERWALGRTDEALQLARKAREADPLSAAYKVREADLYLHIGRLEAAAELYQRVNHDEPADPRAYFGLAEVRRVQRRFDDAIDARRRGHAAAGDESLKDMLATARGEEGYRQIEQTSARLQLGELEARAASAYVSPLDFARVYAQLANRDRSFGYFDAAFADRAPGLVFLKVDRAWDAIRDDPRFVAAVRRVGLP